MHHPLAKSLYFLRGIGMGMQQKGHPGVCAREVLKKPGKQLNLANPSGTAVVDQKQATGGHGALGFKGLRDRHACQNSVKPVNKRVGAVGRVNFNSQPGGSSQLLCKESPVMVKQGVAV